MALKLNRPIPGLVPNKLSDLPRYLQKAVVRGRRDDDIDQPEDFAWGKPKPVARPTPAQRLQAKAHLQAQNAMVAKKLTKQVNKQVKRHLDAQGGTEAIENIVLDMDARGVVTRATFTVPVPPLRQLTPKLFVERLKATVELELELLQEQL